MAWGDAVIVAPETVDGIKTNPIGTGAFKFSNWVQGDKIELLRNDIGVSQLIWRAQHSNLSPTPVLHFPQ